MRIINRGEIFQTDDHRRPIELLIAFGLIIDPRGMARDGV